MKKNTFIQGAVVATIAIVITKIIGVLYVIPFYPLIGEQGGALYGYAYSIYNMFLNLSTAGIPFAISKITSEYNSLGKYYLKEKAYKIGKYFICALGLISFLLLFFFSEEIAFLFIRNIEGGNTIQDVSFVIKMVSFALLIVPALSVLRGYLQGHKFITPSSNSQVIEQVTRVVFLLAGSYFALKVFNLSLRDAVGIAVFAATIGALSAYLYIVDKIRKNKEKLNKHVIADESDKNITTREILKKIIIIAVPFILIDVIRSVYGFIDLLTINKTMVSLGYSIVESEAVVGTLSTWGMKLNSILYAISTGLIISLIPNITSSNALKDTEDVKRKVNKALQALIFVVLPATIGLSFLSTPVWNIFFGNASVIGPLVFSYSIFTAFVVCINNVTSSVLHSLSYSRKVILSIIVGLLAKIILVVPLMKLATSLNIHASYGITTSTIIGFTLCFIFNLYYIKKYTGIKYKETGIRFLKTLVNVLIMLVSLILLSKVVPITDLSRLGYLLITLLYAIIGGIIYLLLSMKTKVIYEIFGDNIFKRIFSKFKKNK